MDYLLRIVARIFFPKDRTGRDLPVRRMLWANRSLTSVRGKYGKKSELEDRRVIFWVISRTGVLAASMPFRNGRSRNATEDPPESGESRGSGFRHPPVKTVGEGGKPRSPYRGAHVGHVYGTERIPWPIRPKKGAEDCEKLWGAVNRRYTQRFPNGGTHRGESSISFLGWTPAELKYLSKRGKEIKIRDSRSSDERNGKSPNQTSAKLRSVACLVLRGVSVRWSETTDGAHDTQGKGLGRPV